MRVICAVALFGWFVWPTPWEAKTTGVLVGEQLLPIDSRVHRVTGHVEGLTLMGWVGPTSEEIEADKKQREALQAAAAATRAAAARDAAAAAAVPAVTGPGMAPAVPSE